MVKRKEAMDLVEEMRNLLVVLINAQPRTYGQVKPKLAKLLQASNKLSELLAKHNDDSDGGPDGLDYTLTPDNHGKDTDDGMELPF